ncbi:MAG TPA: tRNA-uridine aminocarboxypropyltransferase [Burkholderiaceae bacterium]
MPDIPRRPHCDRCDLPLRTCVCALVTRVANEVDVLVLQHPDEAREAKGSARLLRLSLARCRVVVGEVFEPAALLALLDGDVSGSALLYPGDTPAGPDLPSSSALPARPARLVVLDGTWRKAAGLLRANALLQSLPRWPLEPTAPARYRALRKAPKATQLSTLEAACEALAAIEGAPARYVPLLGAFERFVEAGAARAGRPAPPR